MSPQNIDLGRDRTPDSKRKSTKTPRSYSSSSDHSSSSDSEDLLYNNRATRRKRTESEKDWSSETDQSKKDAIKALEEELERYKEEISSCKRFMEIEAESRMRDVDIKHNKETYKSHIRTYRRYQRKAKKEIQEIQEELERPNDELAKDSIGIEPKTSIKSHRNRG